MAPLFSNEANAGLVTTDGNTIATDGSITIPLVLNQQLKKAVPTIPTLR